MSIQSRWIIAGTVVVAASLGAYYMLKIAPGHAASPVVSQGEAPKPAPPKPNAFNVGICLNGKCGVLDQNAKLVVPFENDYDGFGDFILKDSAIATKNNGWVLIDPKGVKPSQVISAQIAEVAPGYFRFTQDNKVGLINAQGQHIVEPRFENIYPGDDAQNYLVYENGGKAGIMNTDGKLVTEAVYDSDALNLLGDVNRKYGGLLLTKRGGDHWLINLKDGSQNKVSYDSMTEVADGYSVVTDSGALKGLIDAKGTPVIPMKYNWLGTPAAGLIAYREAEDKPCGYLDYTGKIVISARFGECNEFGKKSALVKNVAANNGETGKFGAIGRDGAWLVQPVYDYVSPATLGDATPGYADVAVSDGLLGMKAGLFDLDQGRESIPLKYKTIGMLTPTRFVFGEQNGPMTTVSILGESSAMPAVGIMDDKGAVLLKPATFTDIRKDDSGLYLRADNGSATSGVALYNLDGHELISAQWQILKINKQYNVVMGYSDVGTGDNEVRSLRAIYDLQGKPLFVVKKVACGAEQLQDGAGKPIWPIDTKPYCQQQSATAPAESGAQASK